MIKEHKAKTERSGHELSCSPYTRTLRQNHKYKTSLDYIARSHLNLHHQKCKEPFYFLACFLTHAQVAFKITTVLGWLMAPKSISIQTCNL